MSNVHQRIPDHVVNDSSSSEDDSDESSMDESFDGDIEEGVGFEVTGHGTMVFQDSEHNDDDDDESSEEEAPSDEESSSNKRSSDEHSLTSSNKSDASSDEKEKSGTPPKQRRASVGHDLTIKLKKLRILLWGVFIGIMILCTVGMYFFSFKKETSAFETEFKGHGMKVIDSFQDDARRKIEALDSLAALATVYAMDHNLTWPMVTISHSSPLLERYMNIAGAAAIHILPIVHQNQRQSWELYTLLNQGWIDEALAETSFRTEPFVENTRRNLKKTTTTTHAKSTKSHGGNTIAPYIHNGDGERVDTTQKGPWVVSWQYAPISSNRSIINYNHLSSPSFTNATASVIAGRHATMSHIYSFEQPQEKTQLESFMGTHLSKLGIHSVSQEPFVDMYYPINERLDGGSNNSSNNVAIIAATIYWKNYFEHVLPDGVNGIVCVVENSAGEAFTYRMDGPNATFLGLRDMHDSSYDYLVLKGAFMDDHSTHDHIVDNLGHVPLDENFLSYKIRVYPSSTMEDKYKTNTPLLVSFVIFALFILTGIILTAYDFIIGQRQHVLMENAAKTDDIVASLFPETVRSRIMAAETESASFEASGKGPQKRRKSNQKSVASTKSQCTTMSKFDVHGVIADFYPESTVLFTDIKGFTAWCSQREPSQVFILLETLYNTYDIIAKKRKVFKVETIGDCYMAVAGVPEPRADHAVVMCKFAHECLSKMDGLLAGLEVTLGPGTADLKMRFGIHSGPVTAGVIRSQNARFQLFGDTVNTASRMESTGEAGMIQLSQETTDHLIAHGKKHWFVPRKEKISAKGKGELQTYWLNNVLCDDDNRSMSTPSVTGPSDKAKEEGVPTVVELVCEETKLKQQAIAEAAAKMARLVDWNVDVLNRLLRQIVARRLKKGKPSPPSDLVKHAYGPMVVDEMQEMPLPMFDPTDEVAAGSDEGVPELDSIVVDQLYDYVREITKLYNDVPYHNYEHASHVAMSVLKLLGRIVLPNDIKPDDARNAFSDPLTQFTCVLSALINDVGHLGIPNTQLATEKKRLAMYYSNQSIAEQNAIDVSWALLMRDEYAHLRGAIYCDEAEMNLFRYLMVSAVMATDIADGKLKAIRNMRWMRTFAPRAGIGEAPQVVSSRKATIVIEYLMQASDWSHMMQHWHVYRKWTEKAFLEAVAAYQAGRSKQDPTAHWYSSELSFFNNYIIPMTKKLKDCGVFGVSSEEYMNYAVKNRDAWESQGKEIVAEMAAKLNQT